MILRSFLDLLNLLHSFFETQALGDFDGYAYFDP